LIDEATGEMDYDSGFTKSTQILLEKLIHQCLIGKCGYRTREVLLFGFGQGGMVALNVAARLEHGTQSFEPSPQTGGSLKMGPNDHKPSSANGDTRDGFGSQEELGGVISVGGYVPHTTPSHESGKYRSPILLCKAKSKSAVKEHHTDRLRDLFQYVQVVEWEKAGDSMPRSREEMMPIMEFFSRRLRSMRGVPEGSVEIT
jgi:predicted esterase